MSHEATARRQLSQGCEEKITRRLLTIQEVAVYTGLSVHTLYTMVSQRRIPFIKVGRLTKFDRHLLDEWLAKTTVMPVVLKRL